MKNTNPIPRNFVKEDHYNKLLIEVSKEKISITGLADCLGWSLATISKMVNELEKKGLVNRTFGGNKRFIILTEGGKRLLEGVRE